MRSVRNSAFFALIALFLMSGPGFAQINKVVALLKGNAMTASGAAATDVSISVYKGSEMINKTKSTSEGKFQVILQPNTQYRIAFVGPKYYYHEEQLSVPASDVYQTVPMNVTLKELEIGKPYSFSNLIFEPKSSSISSNVSSDLEAIAAAMKHNPNLTVSATVYPDETPSGKKAAAQNSLAASRKASLLAFFLSKNISSANVTIEISNNVPSSGSFERIVTTDAVATKSKKKKKVPVPAPGVAGKKVMVPQYAEIVMQMPS
jgi:hypothetical protein